MKNQISLIKIFKVVVKVGTYIPDDEGVVILTTERGKEFLVVRESKTLDEDFVEL
jgi:hypothetical protein